MHQAQPKEGHKIWLTQEADAKSWSSLKHVQPKEGRKELAPREIKFRYRRLDTTIRERAGSSQVPREARALEWESWISLRRLLGDSNTVVSLCWGLGGLRHFRGAL